MPAFSVGFATGNGMSGMVLRDIWSGIEVIIARWSLAGRHIFWPSLVATILLVLIVLFNIPLIEILFRDVALALVTATLAWWSYKQRRLS